MIKLLKITTDAESKWAFKVERNYAKDYGNYPEITDILVTQKPENLDETCTIYIEINPNDKVEYLCKNAVELFASIVMRFNHMTPYQSSNAGNWHLDYEPDLAGFMKLLYDNPYNRQMASPENLFIVFPYTDSRKVPIDWIPFPWDSYKFKTLEGNTSPNTSEPPNVQNKPQDSIKTINVRSITVETTTGEIYKLDFGR